MAEQPAPPCTNQWLTAKWYFRTFAVIAAQYLSKR